jgi:hypothetical protein
MTMTTNAKPTTTDSSHWYYRDGRPCYELPKKDGSGMKVPTLADARKLDLLPSVTTILKVLHKPALQDWLIEQAVLAVLTSPRLPGEADDAFCYRVLHTERVQDQEGARARDLGTDLHNALELLMLDKGTEVAPDLLPWVQPAFQELSAKGKVIACESCVVGNGYAGRVDLIQREPHGIWYLWDYKTTRKLPDKGAWPEHKLQLAAYARAVADAQELSPDQVITGNVYISTQEQGKYCIWEHGDWQDTYANGFAPLLHYWQFAANYTCASA